MTRSNIFYLRVKTQFDNLGDALINHELMALLAEQGRVLSDLSACPAHFKAWLESDSDYEMVELGPFGLLRAAIQYRRAGQCFWLVLNPGGNIGDISHISFAKRTLKAGFMRVFRMLGGRVLLIGVSYEGLGATNLRLQRILVREIDLHLVRDSETQNYCRKVGLRTDGRLDDLAFHLTPYPVNHDTTRAVLLSFRSRTDGKLQDLKPIVEVVGASNTCFSWQVKRDQTQARELRTAYDPEGELLPCDHTIEQSRLIYAQSALTVTNRLHVFLLALSAGGLAVLLLEEGSNNKIRGIVKDIDLEHLIMTPQDAAALLNDTDRLRTMREQAAKVFMRVHETLITDFASAMEHV